MLLYPKKKTVFVHCPRTSGNYIYRLVDKNPDYIVMKGRFQHLSSNEVYAILPDWKQITILRNPYDIFESHYNMCCYILEHVTNYDLLSYAKNCRTELGSYAHVEYLLNNSVLCKFGGFSTTYARNASISFYDSELSLIEDYLDIKYEKNSGELPEFKNRYKEDMNAGMRYLTQKMIESFCHEDFRWIYDTRPVT